ncbi:hypothetical protein KIN20_000251 [Parelaphostrongylus tenuis]|uniref:Uncharacterized protein n=1 Tax=Parelaphostrongylus tenuis TaxID=148309 RepID=A0AAD5LS69_PARTN|nr:hypothetical protein KIN20_000251 [Parelaphostrongylus tenuis]
MSNYRVMNDFDETDIRRVERDVVLLCGIFDIHTFCGNRYRSIGICAVNYETCREFT